MGCGSRPSRPAKPFSRRSAKAFAEVSFERLWVWEVGEVSERLRWYYMVATNQRPAKYLICRRVPVEPFEAMTYEELW